MGKLRNLTHDEILNLAMCVGKLLLENGAGTARVEEKMLKICYIFGLKDVNVFVTPTFIIVGENKQVGRNLVCRIMNRGINLNVLCVVNKFIHSIDKWDLDYPQTLEYLKKSRIELYKTPIACIFAGLGSGMFSMLLGGTVADFIASFMVAAITVIWLKVMRSGAYGGFWQNCMAGLIIGILSILSCNMCSACHLEKVTVGAIMPFIPGLALTNGLRDMIAGDLMSGNSRISEAVILAVSLALGLGGSMFIALQLQKVLGA